MTRVFIATDGKIASAAPAAYVRVRQRFQAFFSSFARRYYF